jgi:6-phosphogluconolactonase (cycloisomerase 2 family)
MRLSHATVLAVLGLASAAPKPAHKARLWATHYNGNVYTLTLDGDELSLTDTLKTCGNMPSWLTFDSETRVLYCNDEDGTADPSTHGTLTAYHASPNGKLHEIATTKTIGGGVHSVIYENGDGGKYLAIAH